MAFFANGAISPFFVVLFVLLAATSEVFMKGCRKIDNCRCEMDDGSGVIDLSDLDNKDGKPRFTGILEKGTNQYTFNYNPCTPIKSSGGDAACTGANLCQRDGSSSPPTYYPCDASDPTFTVDESNHVVMTYKTLTYDAYTRMTQITLVCDPSDRSGYFGKGVSQIPGTGTSAKYKATLKARSACPDLSLLMHLVLVDHLTAVNVTNISD